MILAFLKHTLGTCLKSDTIEFALTELWLTPEALLTEQTGESTLWKSTDDSLTGPRTLWFCIIWNTRIIKSCDSMTSNYTGHDSCFAQPSHKSQLCLYGYFHTEALATLTYQHGAMMTWIWALKEPYHHCNTPYMIAVAVPYFQGKIS